MSQQDESNLSLEKIIKDVDYVKLGNDYIPSTFAIKFINFIKLVNGEAGEENKSPLFHYEILDTIHKHNNVLVVVFRGGAKTTITAEYMILYIAVFGTLDGFGDVTVAMSVRSNCTLHGFKWCVAASSMSVLSAL